MWDFILSVYLNRSTFHKMDISETWVCVHKPQTENNKFTVYVNKDHSVHFNSDRPNTAWAQQTDLKFFDRYMIGSKYKIVFSSGEGIDCIASAMVTSKDDTFMDVFIVVEKTIGNKLTKHYPTTFEAQVSPIGCDCDGYEDVRALGSILMLNAVHKISSNRTVQGRQE